MRWLRVASVILIAAALAALLAADWVGDASWMVFLGALFIVAGVQRLVISRAVIEHSRTPVDFLDPVRETRVGHAWVRIAGVAWLLFGLAVLAFGIAAWR